MLQPENQTKKYEHLFTDIDSGRIKIPRFQRDFVWTNAQAAKLIDSRQSLTSSGLMRILLWTEFSIPLCRAVKASSMWFCSTRLRVCKHWISPKARRSLLTSTSRLKTAWRSTTRCGRKCPQNCHLPLRTGIRSMHASPKTITDEYRRSG